MESVIITTHSPQVSLTVAELRERLPQDFFRSDLLRSPAKNLFLLAGIVAFSWLIIEIDIWWIEILLSLASGLWVFGLASLAHEAGHRTASRNRFMNEFVGFTTMSIIGLPQRGWKVKHDLHHRHTGIPEGDTDPELLMSKYRKMSPFRRFMAKAFLYTEFLFWPLLVLQLIRTNWRWSIRILRQREKYQTLWVWNIIDMILALGFYGFVVWFGIYFGFWELFVVILLPMLGAGWWAAATFIPNHRAMPILDAEQTEAAAKYSYVNTRTVTFPLVLRFLNFFMNYVPWQIEHHIAPTIPGYRLSKVSKVLLPFAKEKGVELEYDSWVRILPKLAINKWVWDDETKALRTIAEVDEILQREKQQQHSAVPTPA